MGRVSFANVVDETPVAEEEKSTYSVYQYDETPKNKSWGCALPVKQGLYDPELEKDSCGVGFAAYVHLPHLGRCLSINPCDSHIKGVPSHKIVSDGKPTSSS